MNVKQLTRGYVLIAYLCVGKATVSNKPHQHDLASLYHYRIHVRRQLTLFRAMGGESSVTHIPSSLPLSRDITNPHLACQGVSFIN